MNLRVGMALSVTLLFWSTAFVAINEAVHFYSAGSLALLRFSIASLSLLAYGKIVGIRWPARRDLGGILVCGLAGVSIYHLLLNHGEKSVDPGTAAFLINTSPIFTALIARFFLGERLRPLGWLGILISFSGIPLIALGGHGRLEFNPNALLIVGSALSASIYVVNQKRYLARYTSLEFTTYVMVAGTFSLLVFTPELWRELHAAPPHATWLAVYLGLFPAAIGYLTWTVVVAAMPASRAISFLYLVPPLAIFFGWIFKGELPAPLAWVGAALALTGVIVVNRFGRALPASGPLARSASGRALPEAVLEAVD